MVKQGGRARRCGAIRRAGLTLLLGAALAGCASVTEGDRALDETLKRFVAPADLAGLYVVRRGAPVPATAMDVDVDAIPLGRTGVQTYLYRSVAPGRHTVASHAGNTTLLTMEVAAGTLAFVGLETDWGTWAPQTRLRVLDEAEGREAVLASRLALSLEPTQRIEVALQADDPAWVGPLACEASNPFGRWPFSAPGPVTVALARAPLEITCQAPAGAVARGGAPAPATAAESARTGTRTGAAVGAGLGLALGAAAAPVAGPAMILLLTLGGAMRGAEAGGVVAALTTGDLPSYPSPIVVHIRAAATPPR